MIYKREYFKNHNDLSMQSFFTDKKKTIGIRIPANNIIIALVRELGNPILTTSINLEGENVEEYTNPELIHEKYEELVDLVIDGGFGGTIVSTIIDCTGKEPEITREGAGDLDI